MTIKPSPDARLRVFVSDDHPVVLAGVKALIDAAGDMVVVGEAVEGGAAVRLATELKPDVMVLDISMPGLGGAKVADRLREAAPRTRILAHTVHEDIGYLRQMLEVGVKRLHSQALFGRPTGPRNPRRRQGRGLHRPPGGRKAPRRIVAQTGERSGARVDLSDRESEVLRLTAAGYSHKEIAAQLQVGVKSVETYKARGMEKLGFAARVELVRYASGKGWLDEP